MRLTTPLLFSGPSLGQNNQKQLSLTNSTAPLLHYLTSDTLSINHQKHLHFGMLKSTQSDDDSKASTQGMSSNTRKRNATTRITLNTSPEALAAMASASDLNGRAHEFLKTAIDYAHDKHYNPNKYFDTIVESAVAACHKTSPNPAIVETEAARVFRAAIDIASSPDKPDALKRKRIKAEPKEPQGIQQPSSSQQADLDVGERFNLQSPGSIAPDKPTLNDVYRHFLFNIRSHVTDPNVLHPAATEEQHDQLLTHLFNKVYAPDCADTEIANLTVNRYRQAVMAKYGRLLDQASEAQVRHNRAGEMLKAAEEEGEMRHRLEFTF